MSSRRYTPEFDPLETRTLLNAGPSASIAISGIQMATAERMPIIDMTSAFSATPAAGSSTVRIAKRPHQPIAAVASMPTIQRISYAPDWNKIDWSKPQEIFWDKITKQEWMTVPAKVLKQIPWHAIDASLIKNLPWENGMQDTMQGCLPEDIFQKFLSPASSLMPETEIHDEALQDINDDMLGQIFHDTQHQTSAPVAASVIALSSIGLAQANHLPVSSSKMSPELPSSGKESVFGKIGNFFKKKFTRKS